MYILNIHIGKATASLQQNREVHKLRGLLILVGAGIRKGDSIVKWKKTDLEARQVCVQVLSLVLTSCVPLGKSVNLSEPQLLRNTAV